MSIFQTLVMEIEDYRGKASAIKWPHTFVWDTENGPTVLRRRADRIEGSASDFLFMITDHMLTPERVRALAVILGLLPETDPRSAK